MSVCSKSRTILIQLCFQKFQSSVFIGRPSQTSGQAGKKYKTMDPERASDRIKSMPDLVKAPDLNNSQLPSLSEEEFDVMSPEDIDLVVFKLQPETKIEAHYKVCISQTDRRRVFQLFLRSKYYSGRIASIYLWDSKITEKDIQLVTKNGSKFREVALVSCTVDNRLLRELSLTFSKHIYVLILESIPIDHRAIKTLTQIDMPLLYYLVIGNTFISTDCSKLLSKRSQHKIFKLSIEYLPWGNENIFLKTASLNIRLFKQPQLFYTNKLSVRPFLFANHLAKFERESEDPIPLTICCFRGLQSMAGYQETICMNPKATLRNLEKIIAFEWW